MRFRIWLESSPGDLAMYLSVLADYRNPDMWLILADWLADHGDPLADFIRLVITRQPNPRGKMRQLNALIRQQLSRWRVLAIPLTINPYDPSFDFRDDQGRRLELYPTGHNGRMSSSLMPAGMWTNKPIPPNTLIHRMRPPHYYNQSYPNAPMFYQPETWPEHPDNPETWDFPWLGNRAEMDPDLIRRVVISTLLLMVPRHIIG